MVFLSVIFRFNPLNYPMSAAIKRFREIGLQLKVRKAFEVLFYKRQQG
jgi:hypothetical protein